MRKAHAEARWWLGPEHMLAMGDDVRGCKCATCAVFSRRMALLVMGMGVSVPGCIKSERWRMCAVVDDWSVGCPEAWRQPSVP